MKKYSEKYIKKNIIVYMLLIMMPISIFAQWMGVAKRKDELQYISIDSRLVSKQVANEINLYFLDYAKYDKDPKAKDKYYDELEKITDKLVLEGKSLNLVVPYDFIYDINNMDKEAIYLEEEKYAKLATNLTAEDIRDIDKEYPFESSDNLGFYQEYLNRQVYYWLAYLGRGAEYDRARVYTEDDKFRYMREARLHRQQSRDTMYVLLDNLILDGDTATPKQLYSYTGPIYLSYKQFADIDMDRLKSNVIFTNGDIREVSHGKLILNVNNRNNHLKNIRFSINIATLRNSNDIGIYAGSRVLTVKELTKFKEIEPKDRNVKSASVRKAEISTKKIDFLEDETQWGVK